MFVTNDRHILPGAHQMDIWLKDDRLGVNAWRHPDQIWIVHSCVADARNRGADIRVLPSAPRHNPHIRPSHPDLSLELHCQEAPVIELSGELSRNLVLQERLPSASSSPSSSPLGLLVIPLHGTLDALAALPALLA